MAINFVTAEMNQVFKNIETHWAAINSNWHDLTGGDIEAPLAALQSQTLALHADLGILLLLVGKLTTAVNARSAGA